MSSDESVQGTNDDAAISKLSAVTLGYYKDPYLHYFIHTEKPIRRAPLINRGYYARVQAVFDIALQFATRTDMKCQQRQFISLGAGFDTLFMRLRDATPKTQVRYIELDFGVVMHRKATLIKRHNVLNQDTNTYTNTDNPSKEYWSFANATSSYHMCGVDLRNLKDIESVLNRSGIDYSVPTMILSECVLVYIDPVDSGNIIKWLATKFSDNNEDNDNNDTTTTTIDNKDNSKGEEEEEAAAGGGAIFLAYEQIHPFDRFGQTMMNHLRSRGASLKGLEAYPDISAHRERYLSRGWMDHAGWNMNDIYKYFISSENIRRIEKLELFDEFEEWHIINDHYCLSLASIDTKITQGVLKNSGFLCLNVEEIKKKRESQPYVHKGRVTIPLTLSKRLSLSRDTK